MYRVNEGLNGLLVVFGPAALSLRRSLCRRRNLHSDFQDTEYGLQARGRGFNVTYFGKAFVGNHVHLTLRLCRHLNFCILVIILNENGLTCQVLV